MAVRIGNKSYGDRGQTGMGAQADTEPDPTDVNEPTEQAAGEPQEGEGGKYTQEQCNYRRSNGRNCCGVCNQYVHGEDKAPMGSCVTVEGDISAYGLCDYFASVGNPFGPLPPAQRLRKAQNRLVRAQARMAGPQPQAAQQGQGPTY